MRRGIKQITSAALVLLTLFTGAEYSAYAWESSEYIVEHKQEKEVNYDMGVNSKGKHNIIGKKEKNNRSKVKLRSVDETIRYENQNEICYDFHLDSLEKYDYTVVTFESSEGLNLPKGKEKRVEYNKEGAEVALDFSLDTCCTKDKIVLDYDKAKFQKIKVNVDAVCEDEIVQTEGEEFSVYPTEYGTFMSKYGDVFAYDGYLTYLHENSLITEEELKEACKSVTELECVQDEDTSEMQREVKEAQAFSAARSVMATSLYSTNKIVSPSIKVTRTITSLSSGSKLKVYGYVYWTDITGTTIPARNIEVQIMDEDVQFDDVRATVYTNNNGYYTATFDNQKDSLEKGCDIFIRVNTCNEDFEIGPGIVTTLFADGYYFTTPVTSNVTTSKVQETYKGEGDDAHRAISVHQALVVGYYYYETMNDDDVNTIDVKYPREEKGSESDSFWDLVEIGYSDYCDWDAIIHELGHQVASQIGVYATFTDEHGLRENLSERYGKKKGIKGAWNEGWASYFSMAAQNYYTKQVVNISNIVNVADNAYTNLEFNPSDTIYDEKSYVYAEGGDVGYGESNEAAVTYVLLHLVEDGIFTHQELWDIAKKSACNNFSEFMQTLYDEVPVSEYSAIGKLLESQNVVDKPLGTTATFSKATPGTIKWECAAVLGTKYRNQFRVVFWDANYNKVFETGLVTSDADNKSLKLSKTQWEKLVNTARNGVFYWCLATYQTSSPSTGPYYSEFIKGTIK